MNHYATLAAQSPLPAMTLSGDSTIEAFRWMLIFGFPAGIAAARLMPEVFTDAISDAVGAARSLTRNPFRST
jgi:hypothetical protein